MLDGASSECYHSFGAGEQLHDCFVLQTAKLGLAVSGEDVSYRATVALFDVKVDIDECQAKLSCQQLTDRRLASSHEPHQDYRQLDSSAAYCPATFEGPPERELVGVFEVAADRQPARQLGHFQRQLFEELR